MRSRPALPLALLVVLGLVAGVLTFAVATVVEEPDTAEAVPAPTFPTPQCDVDESGNEGLGCTPAPVKGLTSDSFSQGNTFTVHTQQGGLQPCLTYVSTGCYYSLSNPSFVRCVYLKDNDPYDVRSCSGSLSTQGSVYTSSASREGRCSGALGGTYAYGGDARYPETWWNARAVVYAACQFTVPDIPIDNLRGPTFILVRTSVRECIEPGGGFGCDESWATLETRNEYGWLPVEGDLAPEADFEVIRAGGDGLRFRFENTSTPFATGTTTYEWNFGDGTTSTATSPTHTFESMGTKLVRLTMRSSEGPTRSATEWIDLEPPDLSVLVYNPSAEFGPGKQGNRFNIGDEVTVKVKVSATEGVGYLDDVAPVDALLALPEQFEFVLAEPVEGEPPPEPPTADPARFRPGDVAEYDVTIRAVKPGRATIRSNWNGNDTSGNPTGPWSGSFETSVTGLKVEILPDPESFKRDDTDGDDDIDEDDNHVEVEVKVTNVSEAPITDISKGELLVTSKVEDDPLPRFMLVASPVDDPSTPDVDEGAFGDLDPGESHSLTWTYGAEEALHVDLSMLITGNQAGATITSLGEAVVKAFDNVVLEAKIAPGANPSYASGKPIRIDGQFTNVTDRPEAEEELTIAFAAVPRFEEAPGSLSTEKLPLNGAGGYFGTGGATPTGIERFELAPGATANLRSIVETLETDLPTGFTVDYQVVASVKEVSDTGEVTWEPLDELEIDVVEKDGFSAEHKITLGAVPPDEEDRNFFSCDPEVLWTAEYIGCKLVRGVETAARGFGDLLQLGWTIARGTVAGYGWVLGTTFEMLVQDDAGRAAIAADIAAELVELKNLGHQVLQNLDAEQILLAVPAALDRGIRRLADAWDAGAEIFLGEVAEVAGENIDMVLEALVAARALAKVSKALAVDGDTASVISRLWAQRKQRALAEADDIIASQGAKNVPGSRVLPAGIDVTDAPKIWKDGYGLSQRQLKALQDLTKEYGVNITFRSRAPGSIDLIESGRALPKPQGIKTKGVNEIDVDFLGYHPDYADKVVHMEPPIPLQGSKKDLDDAAAAYARKVVSEKRPGLSGAEYDDLVKQVTERVKTRHDEWAELTPVYTDALKVGENGKPNGVKVDFDGDFNGAPGERLRYEENRPIDLVPGRGGPDAGNRSVYEVKLQAPPGHPKAGDFLDVTGDVDFLGILKPDGTVLGANGDPAELAKRLEIYEIMRADPIGMQHGESFTIAVSDKVRAKYLRDGVDAEGGETVLTVTPQQRVITSYFDDGLSTLKVGDATLAELGNFRQARAVFRGVFTELASPDRAWTRRLVEQVNQSWLEFKRAVYLFDLSILARYVNELNGIVSDSLSRGGELIRPDGEGGIERYVPGSVDRASSPLVAGRSAERSTVGVDASTAIVGELEAHLAAIQAAGIDTDPAGAQGGRWVPVEVADVLTDGRLSVAPYAYLATAAVAGTTDVVVTTKEQLRLPSTSDWFAVGDRIVIDPGGPQEETAVVASVSPFKLASPLANTHDELTMVILAPAVSVGSVSPITPARLADTRRGETTVDGALAGIGQVAAGTSLRIPVWGRGGVPNTATAVVVNTVAVAAAGGGYLSLYPCDGPVPSTSNVNYGSRYADVNNALVKLSADGAVCVYTHAAADVVMDVTAYSTGSEALAPRRLAESRSGFETDDGRQQAFGRVAAGSTTVIEVAGRGGVPVGAAAVAVNVTTVNAGGDGYLTLYPCDEDRPLASNLNYATGDTRPNAAIVALSASGTFCVYAWRDLDLVVDVMAWFEDTPSFSALNPARLVETRAGEKTADGQQQGIGRLAAGSTTKVQVAGRGGVPADARTAAVNSAAIFPSGGGYFTLYPCDEDRPPTSSGNYEAGDIIANSGVVKLAGDGSVCVFTSQATDFILDVNAAWTT